MSLQSSVAWIDFAEEDRRRMTEVVSRFGERDTRDELGVMHASLGSRSFGPRAELGHGAEGDDAKLKV